MNSKVVADQKRETLFNYFLRQTCQQHKNNQILGCQINKKALDQNQDCFLELYCVHCLKKKGIELDQVTISEDMVELLSYHNQKIQFYQNKLNIKLDQLKEQKDKFTQAKQQIDNYFSILVAQVQARIEYFEQECILQDILLVNTRKKFKSEYNKIQQFIKSYVRQDSQFKFNDMNYRIKQQINENNQFFDQLYDIKDQIQHYSEKIILSNDQKNLEYPQDNGYFGTVQKIDNQSIVENKGWGGESRYVSTNIINEKTIFGLFLRQSSDKIQEIHLNMDQKYRKLDPIIINFDMLWSSIKKYPSLNKLTLNFKSCGIQSAQVKQLIEIVSKINSKCPEIKFFSLHLDKSLKCSDNQSREVKSFLDKQIVDFEYVIIMNKQLSYSNTTQMRYQWGKDRNKAIQLHDHTIQRYKTFNRRHRKHSFEIKQDNLKKEYQQKKIKIENDDNI